LFGGNIIHENNENGDFSPHPAVRRDIIFRKNPYTGLREPDNHALAVF
jgi:hypothetical protein